MNIAHQLNEVAKLKALAPDGHFSRDALPLVGGYQGLQMTMSRHKLQSAWQDAAGTNGFGKAAHIRLSNKRLERRKQQVDLCDELAHTEEVILLEYSFEFAKLQRSMVILSRGACELLAIHFGSATGAGTLFSAKDLNVLKRANGLVGEFRKVVEPTYVDAVQLMREKLAPIAA
jgi:hypothetical protein